MIVKNHTQTNPAAVLVGALAMGGLATWSMLQTEQQFSCGPAARRTELKRESKQMYSAAVD